MVLLPHLSAAQGRDDREAYSALLDWGLRLTLLLALPCSTALLVFPEPLVAVLFHYGAFGVDDVHQTVRALRGYGVGLLGLIAVKVLAPGFYARQDIRTPVRIAVGVLVLTQIVQCAAGAVARPCRAGAVDQPGGAAQCHAAARRAGARRPLPAGAGLAAL